MVHRLLLFISIIRMTVTVCVLRCTEYTSFSYRIDRKLNHFNINVHTHIHKHTKCVWGRECLWMVLFFMRSIWMWVNDGILCGHIHAACIHIMRLWYDLWIHMILHAILYGRWWFALAIHTFINRQSNEFPNEKWKKNKIQQNWKKYINKKKNNK